jgi:hypothetical protein
VRSPTHYRQRIAAWTEWLDENGTASPSTRQQVERVLAAYRRVLPESEIAFERLRAVLPSDDVAGKVLKANVAPNTTRGAQNRSTAARRRGVGVRRKTTSRTQYRRSA